MSWRSNRRSARKTGWRFGAAILLTGALCGVAMPLLAAPMNDTGFDHFSTGFELRGAHARASCASCHTGGVFQGTPSTCAACHSQAGLVTTTRQPSHHILTTNQCSACHQPQSWTPVIRVDHLETLGTCASCHNNIRAMGQPANHLPTGNDCGACHNTRLFAFARFSHAGIDTGCFNCHNGVQAIGKPADHIPSSNQCETCHNTVMFEGARP